MQAVCNWILVLALLVNALNVPIAMRPTSGLLDQRFPCEKRGCGCHVERCWTTCSCTSPREKLEWSVREAVQPPLAFLERLGISITTWQYWTKCGITDPAVLTAIAQAVGARSPAQQDTCCQCSSAEGSCGSTAKGACGSTTEGLCCAASGSLQLPPDNTSHSAVQSRHCCGTNANPSACGALNSAANYQQPTRSIPRVWDTYRCGVPADEVVLLFGQTFIESDGGLDQPLEFADWVCSESFFPATVDLPPPTPPPRCRLI